MRNFLLSTALFLLIGGSLTVAPNQQVSANPVCFENVFLGGGSTMGGAEIPSSIVRRILHQATFEFGVTDEVLQLAYDLKLLTIKQIGQNTYLVEYGGGAAILILDGSN